MSFLLRLTSSGGALMVESGFFMVMTCGVLAPLRSFDLQGGAAILA
jgi:hypothetical protein